MSKKTTVKMLTLPEYELIAKKILLSQSSHVYKMVEQDADLHTDILTTIMLADTEWDGRGTLEGYRKQRVIWRLHLQYKRWKQKRDYVPIDCLDSEHSYQYSEPNPPLANLLLDYLPQLTVRQQECLRYRQQGLTLLEIGNKLHITKEAVRLQLNKGVETLRELINSDDGEKHD